MTPEFKAVLEAKRVMKDQISFFEDILKKLNGTDKVLRSSAAWASWCLHHYITNKLVKDIQEAIQRAQAESKNVK